MDIKKNLYFFFNFYQNRSRQTPFDVQITKKTYRYGKKKEKIPFFFSKSLNHSKGRYVKAFGSTYLSCISSSLFHKKVEIIVVSFAWFHIFLFFEQRYYHSEGFCIFIIKSQPLNLKYKKLGPKFVNTYYPSTKKTLSHGIGNGHSPRSQNQTQRFQRL